MNGSGLVEAPMLRCRIPARPDELAPLRHTLRTWLCKTGAAVDTIHDVVLAASEACANAIEHPVDRRDRFIDLEAKLVDDEVQLSVRDTGAWRLQAAATPRGRGLLLINGLMDEIVIERSLTGTELRMTRRLSSEPVGLSDEPIR